MPTDNVEQSAMVSREDHVYIIDFLLSGKSLGELLAQRKITEAQKVLEYVRTGPDDNLAMTDPSLYVRIQDAIIRLRLKGWS